MTVIIRKMNANDISEVQAIARISWHTTYENIIPIAIQNNFLDMAYNDEQMKQRLDHSMIYIAEVAGQVVGFANYSFVREDGNIELAAIYLHPNAQGQGIGTLLLQQAWEEIDGVKAIYINVEKDNAIGMHFYKAKGFEIVSEFDDDFDGHLLKTVRMVLKIKQYISPRAEP